MFETITINFSGKVRRAIVNGKQYLVAPMTLIVPGVLNGSKGRLFYPPEEVSKDPSIWHGVPLTLGHPTHPTTNEHQSANDEGVLERVGLGITKNGRWDGSKLRSDGWFDEERTRTLAPDVYNKLNKSEPFELSTGLYTENIPMVGNYLGKPYDFVARNYRSDHVAVLVNEVGACSVKDGCGVIVNTDATEQDSDLEGLTLIEAQEPAVHVFNVETGLCSNCGGVGGNPGPCPMGGGGIHPKQKTTGLTAAEVAKISARFLEVFGGASAAKSASALAHRASRKAFAKPLIVKHKGGFKPAEVNDRHIIVEKAKKAGSRPSAQQSAEDHSALAKRHEEISSKVVFSTPEGKAAFDAHTTAAKAHHAAAKAFKGTRNEETVENKEKCPECDATMKDGKCSKCDYVAKKKPPIAPPTENVVNRNDMLAKLTANCTCDKDKAALNGLSDETLGVLVNSQPPPAKKPDVAITVNTTTPESAKPMAERMTPEELQVWNYGRQSMENHKLQLVNKLVANIADPARKTAMTANLLLKGIPELNDLLSLMPAPAPTQNTTFNPGGTDLPPIYLGAAGGDFNPTVNRVAESVDLAETEEWPPTLNYAEMADLPKRGVAAVAG